MTTQIYDLIVIGAGGAGSTAATTAAAKYGARVALIERDKLGGTCLNYGCDPTKTLLHTAQVLYQAQHAAELGVRIPIVEFDWPAVQAHVQQVLTRIRGGTMEEGAADLKRQGVDVIWGEARFVSAHEVLVASQVYRAPRIIIAAGTDAFIPEIEGLREAGFITNKEAVSLPKLPKRLTVVGAGPIGLEFAQLFHRFGVQVTVLQRAGVPLDREDRELAETLCALLAAEGIRIEIASEMRCGEHDAVGKRIYIQHSGRAVETLVVDEILVALGRRVALDALQLSVTGVQVTDGRIASDATLRTHVPHIWAAGDVTSVYQFTHVASAQGELAAHNAFSNHPQPFDDRVIPWVTYTDPELARAGQTEEQLRADGIAYRVGRVRFNQMDRALATNQTAGMVKMLADADGHILGTHILGANAGDLIAPAIFAMRTNQTAAALAETILPYPTMAEAVRWTADQLKD